MAGKGPQIFGAPFSKSGMVSQAHARVRVRVDMVLRLHYRPRGSGLVNRCSTVGTGDCTPPETLWEISHMNTKMKVLSLALVGLGGLAFAGVSMAACPSSPVPPWTSTFSSPGSSFVIADGGLDGSACKAVSTLAASITAGATVTDDTPSNEATYRFQFMIDPGTLSAFGTTHSVTVFKGNSAAAANGSNNLVTAYIIGASGGAKRVRFSVACGSSATFRCNQSAPVDLPAGVSRIEGNLVVGAGSAGKFEYWINAPTGTTPPPATGTISDLNNTAWVGVNRAILGLAAPTSAFAAAHAGQGVGFDAFDSRRTNYIGH